MKLSTLAEHDVPVAVMIFLVESEKENHISNW